jgi:hypothetical protein
MDGLDLDPLLIALLKKILQQRRVGQDRSGFVGFEHSR